MNLKECKEIMRKYSLARIPFISFKTIERARAVEVLEDVAEDLSLSFYIHTMSKGMSELGTGKIVNDDKSIMGALDFISQQIAVKQNLTFILTEVSDIDGDTLTSRYFYDIVTLAEENGGCIVVLNSGGIWSQLQRLGMSVILDFPDEDEMLAIIQDNIRPYAGDIKVEWDDTDFLEGAAILAGISRVEAQNVIASLIATRHIKKSDLTELRFAKDKLFSNINGLEKIKIDEEILSVGGLNGLKKWLEDKRKLQTPKKRDEMRARGLQPPNGILLVGVPGCGKSLSAKAIAVSWKLPLYRLDFATVQGQYVGQSEQQLKEAFQTAEHVAPCVLWIDEIEKGLSGAGSDSSGVTNRMVGQFLFWMQECRKHVFVVATANDVSRLPSELLRRGRFDELFFIDLPSSDEREEILSLYGKKYLERNFEDMTLDNLVELTEGFTGADIESAIRDLAYRVLANNIKELEDEEIMKSIKNVVPLSKTSPEKIDDIRNWGKSRAVPASGHPIGGKVEDNKVLRRVIL